MIRNIVFGLSCLGLPVSGLAVDYLVDVKPVLQARCYACHGALKQKGGLRLDTVTRMREGDVITPGMAAESELVTRIRANSLDDRMPPEGEALSADEISAIIDWINGGAEAPADEVGDQDPRDHWAFVSPEKSEFSAAVVGRSGVRNPIDALIGAKQGELGLTPQPAASDELLIRRVYLDLIGLPPSREERLAFLSDERPDAYERLVDRLLGSPQYGERWGRHWMDVWRYTDWYGLGAQLRFSQKHIWRWRDWIIESLNEDKGYDQMIREMLAGDELAPTDPSVLRATGYLARNYYLFNRDTWLEQTIEHTGQAFLGLTMQCAKCHDHKYDPISQEDYYRFRAFFEPHQVRLDAVPGETDLEADGLPRVFDAHPEAPTYLYRRGSDKDPDKSRVLTSAVPSILAWEELRTEEKALPPEAYFPGLQTFVLGDRLREAERAIERAERGLENCEDVSGCGLAELKLTAAKRRPAALRAAHRADRAQHGLDDSVPADEAIREAAQADQAYQLAAAEAALAEARRAVGTAEEKKRDAAKKQLERAEKELAEREKQFEENPNYYTSLRGSLKALESPAETNDSRRKPYARKTTGRRSALAAWITDQRNPLTARVAVNHIWMRHFGEPLVADVQDFGRRSKEPPLQDVLDFLAVTFMESGWRMKPLHRLMVTSEAYRRSSSAVGAEEETLAADPDNRFLWRRHALRMESQVLRDTMRHLAEQLDLTLGGPTIDPSKGENQGRRSLYFTHSRDDQHRFLSMFDDAEILACYRRSVSIIPQQALALVNSRLSLSLAESVAQRVDNDLLLDDENFVLRAFESVLGEAPTGEEQKLCLDLIREVRAALKGLSAEGKQRRARRNLIQALFNHNDFITIR